MLYLHFLKRVNRFSLVDSMHFLLNSVRLLACLFTYTVVAFSAMCWCNLIQNFGVMILRNLFPISFTAMANFCSASMK